MDGYPFNLILAVATATATILLGFLPTNTIKSSFFGQQAFFATIAWLIVASLYPLAIAHYPVVIAILSGGAWWKFRADRALSGKMWLSIASGLGISIGVMLLLAVTPRAYPQNLPQPAQALLLTSIYLGGIVIGLGYFCYTLSQSLSLKTGITHALLQRYTGLLVILVLARAAVLLVLLFMTPGLIGRPQVNTYDLSGPEVQHSFQLFGHTFTEDMVAAESGTIHISLSCMVLLILTVILLPILAFLSQNATRLQSRTLPTRPLLAFIVLAAIAEVLARLLVL